ncbi:MAG TPA: hypothetical protein VHY22_13395 [Chthoniobacteraceae bacterium]|nr:hypothetical protein [Chthoniobacteraceae bacterium]
MILRVILTLCGLCALCGCAGLKMPQAAPEPVVQIIRRPEPAYRMYSLPAWGQTVEHVSGDAYRTLTAPVRDIKFTAWGTSFEIDNQETLPVTSGTAQIGPFAIATGTSK